MHFVKLLAVVLLFLMAKINKKSNTTKKNSKKFWGFFHGLF